MIGSDPVRVTGQAKVTGQARYVAEFAPPGCLHSRLVEATVASGTIASLETGAAQAVPGVKLVLSHLNFPKLSPPKQSLGMWEEILPLQGTEIHYDGQAVAMVVATSPEAADLGARELRVKYQASPPITDLTKADLQRAEKMFNRPINHRSGQVDPALAGAAFKVDQVYETPVTSHAQMELIASLAHWTDQGLTLYQTTQAVQRTQMMVAEVLGLPPDQVRVLCPYVGGAFGIKGFLGPGAFLTAVASKRTGQPVLLEMSRQAHFSNAGHRGRTVQRVVLGADQQGKLVALRHQTDTETSFRAMFIETAGAPSLKLYGVPNLEVSHRVARVHRTTPCPTRGPGETPGTFALESAIDELAHQAGLDPVEFRLRNDTVSEPASGKPYSTRNLAECLRAGSQRFGWGTKPEVAGWLVGHGVAAGVFPAHRRPASCRVVMSGQGPIKVQAATHDLGTGAYTVMTQVAGESLELPLEELVFELGDSALPDAPITGGSSTTASVAPAVQAACLAARQELLERAAQRWGVPVSDVTYSGGTIRGGGRKLGWRELVQQSPLSVERATNSDQDDKFAYSSFGAHFLEVLVDPDLGIVRSHRLVSVFDIGQVVNPRTAASQIYGGAIYGLGMALMEEIAYGPDGRIATRNLADYHVPVHPDIPAMEVIFVGQPDLAFNPIGCRGAGEIGTTGIAAAVANAVFDATGKRIRRLPITLDKLLS